MNNTHESIDTYPHKSVFVMFYSISDDEFPPDEYSPTGTMVLEATDRFHASQLLELAIHNMGYTAELGYSTEYEFARGSLLNERGELAYTNHHHDPADEEEVEE